MSYMSQFYELDYHTILFRMDKWVAMFMWLFYISTKIKYSDSSEKCYNKHRYCGGGIGRRRQRIGREYVLGLKLCKVTEIQILTHNINKKNMSITVGQKVKITQNDGRFLYGTITHVYPPCDFHSGRFTVLMHDRYMSSSQEFWYSDYGKTVTDSK